MESIHRLYQEHPTNKIFNDRKRVLALVIEFTSQIQKIVADLDQTINARGYFHSVKLKTAISAELKRTLLILLYPPSGANSSNNNTSFPSPVSDLWSTKKRRHFLMKLLHKTWLGMNHVDQPTLVNLIRYLTPIHAQHFALSALSSPVEESVQNLMSSSLIRSSEDSQNVLLDGADSSSGSSNFDENELAPTYSLSQFIPFNDDNNLDGGHHVMGEETSAPVHRRDLQQLEIVIIIITI